MMLNRVELFKRNVTIKIEEHRQTVVAPKHKLKTEMPYLIGCDLFCIVLSTEDTTTEAEGKRERGEGGETN